MSIHIGSIKTFKEVANKYYQEYHNCEWDWNKKSGKRKRPLYEGDDELRALYFAYREMKKDYDPLYIMYANINRKLKLVKSSQLAIKEQLSEYDLLVNELDSMERDFKIYMDELLEKKKKKKKR